MGDRQPATRAMGASVHKARSVPTTSVRRNLFQNRHTVSTSSSSVETLRLDVDAHSEPREIVVRGNNGEIELSDLPVLPMDDTVEMTPDPRQERQRLADAVKQHQVDQTSIPTQPEELLEAVRASLRAKVAALAEDNWLFEREEIPRFQ